MEDCPLFSVVVYNSIQTSNSTVLPTRVRDILRFCSYFFPLQKGSIVSNFFLHYEQSKSLRVLAISIICTQGDKLRWFCTVVKNWRPTNGNHLSFSGLHCVRSCGYHQSEVAILWQQWKYDCVANSFCGVCTWCSTRSILPPEWR